MQGEVQAREALVTVSAHAPRHACEERVGSACTWQPSAGASHRLGKVLMEVDVDDCVVPAAPASLVEANVLPGEGCGKHQVSICRSIDSVQHSYNQLHLWESSMRQLSLPARFRL